MKRIIALLLSGAMLLTGCTSAKNNESQSTTVVSQIETTEGVVIEATTSETNIEDIDVDLNQFTNLDNQDLLQYVEDNIYAELVNTLDPNLFYVQEVSSVYISKEYLEEVAYNSQSNIFFGYTLAELNETFNDTKYVFTLGENGETTVQELVVLEDNVYDEVITKVAIGTGVILLCVTVSVVTGGVGAPAISMIFAASAKTGAVMALSSAAN